MGGVLSFFAALCRKAWGVCGRGVAGLGLGTWVACAVMTSCAEGDTQGQTNWACEWASAKGIGPAAPEQRQQQQQFTSDLQRLCNSRCRCRCSRSRSSKSHLIRSCCTSATAATATAASHIGIAAAARAVAAAGRLQQHHRALQWTSPNAIATSSLPAPTVPVSHFPPPPAFLANMYSPTQPSWGEILSRCISSLQVAPIMSEGLSFIDDVTKVRAASSSTPVLPGLCGCDR